jgi:hypothetical protein
MPTIQKLNTKIFAFQKKICGLPLCTPNITTQLPHDLFGVEAFSIKNAYFTCINKLLRNTLNDIGRLRKIYIGLTNYILIKHTDCIRSPSTRTIFLFKEKAHVHIKSMLLIFHYIPHPLKLYG